MQHDLAILKLNKLIDLEDSIQLACLPVGQPLDYPQAERHAYIVGWGDVDENSTAPYVLKNAKVKIFNLTGCDKTVEELNKSLNETTNYSKYMIDNSIENVNLNSSIQICAGRLVKL